MSDARRERQEIHCHACNNYVQFDIDLSLNGNHIFKCPKCGHEHCRVVRNGEITGDRWAQRNGDTIWIRSAATSWSASSTYTATSTTSASSFLQQSWYDSDSTGGWYF